MRYLPMPLTISAIIPSVAVQLLTAFHPGATAKIVTIVRAPAAAHLHTPKHAGPLFGTRGRALDGRGGVGPVRNANTVRAQACAVAFAPYGIMGALIETCA